MTPKKKKDKEKQEQEFSKAKEQAIAEHPTPDENSQDHVGVSSEPKKRHRRTRAEIAEEKNRMADTANPLFVPVLKMPFLAAAKAHRDLRIELSDEEALRWALPITQLMEHYCPNMPHIWFAWGNLVLTTWTIIEIRMRIIAELKKKNVQSDKPSGEKSSSSPRQAGVGQKFPTQTELKNL